MSKIKDNYSSSLVLTHDLIGGKWKLRILWHIINGENRFSILKRVIPEITEKVLYTNLRELEESGVIYKRVVENKVVKSVFYFLEEAHKELVNIIYAMNNFSKRYAEINKIDIV